MTPERKTEIRKAAASATPPPWRTVRTGKTVSGFTCDIVVAAVARGQAVYCTPAGGTFPEADRQFIALARTAVPELLTEVDRLEAELVEQRARNAALQAGQDELHGRRLEIWSREKWGERIATLEAELEAERERAFGLNLIGGQALENLKATEAERDEARQVAIRAVAILQEVPRALVAGPDGRDHFTVRAAVSRELSVLEAATDPWCSATAQEEVPA